MVASSMGLYLSGNRGINIMMMMVMVVVCTAASLAINLHVNSDQLFFTGSQKIQNLGIF